MMKAEINMNKKKLTGIFILLFAYIIAFIGGFITYLLLEKYLELHILMDIFLANVVATIIIWIIGIFFKSASIYDPYWSVQTIIIFLCLLVKFQTFNLGIALFLAVLAIYTIRLTGNFLIGFNDISYIDWRYKQIKEKCGKLYQFVSLIGIHLIPTFVVYFASVPSFMYIINGLDFSPFNFIGLAVMLLGIALEFFADMDMKKFQKIRTSKSEIIRVGLWKYSRHPNYLGEIIFWFGVALVYIIPNFANGLYFSGAVTNLLLFIFISVPLADNHLKTYKAHYEEYRKETRCFLPFPRFKIKKNSVTKGA